MDIPQHVIFNGALVSTITWTMNDVKIEVENGKRRNVYKVSYSLMREHAFDQVVARRVIP
jgi:hypothetical protein